MLRLARFLLTVPVLVLPISAAASTLSAEQGLSVLAKAKASDAKCGFLSKKEHSELSGYLARAEVASQGLMSGKTANAAIRQGRDAGKAGKCGEAARNDVEETLAAARLAVAQADGVKPAKPAKAEKAGKIGPATPAEYRILTKPYFVDLRCKQLGGRKASLYYEAIKDLQAASIAKHGTAAIATAQGRARKEARGVTCGPASKKQAEEGLTAILRK